MGMNHYSVRTGRFDFKVDPENGHLIGPDECHYDSLPEAMFHCQLGICGCGNPEGNHELACKVVACFDRDRRGWKYGEDNGTTAVTELVKADPEQAAELLVQLLDKCDLFEHGGSVHGSWLTERGKQFLEIGPIGERD